jgi:hypothetical protein
MPLIWSRPSKRRWRYRLVPAIAALLLLGNAATAQEQPVAAIGDQPIEIAGAEGSGTLLVFSSHPLLARMPGVTRLLVVVHGAGRDADHAEAQGVAAIGPAIAQTLVVAPQFLSEADFHRWTLPGDRLRWAGPGWAKGDVAVGPAPVSPFSALDSLVHGLADPSLLPDLKAVTIAGEGEGADLVQLYAAATTHLAALEARGIAFHFVLAAPGHYLYLDEARPVPADAASCPGFDQWPYGLDGAPAYLDELGPARIFTQYRARDVVYLLGKPAGAADAGCAAAAQGPDRPARGRFYLAYLAKLAGAPVHRLAETPTVEATALLASACGVAALLDRPDCPALASPPGVPAFPEPVAPAAEPARPAEASPPSAPEAAPTPPAPVIEALPPPSPPDQVEPGGLVDPLHEADPLSPLLTRAPPPAKPPPR